MQGPTGVPDLKGVIPNAISHVFEAIGGSKDVGWLVRCSYLEIYNEEIKDLLGDQKVRHSLTYLAASRRTCGEACKFRLKLSTLTLPPFFPAGTSQMRH